MSQTLENSDLTLSRFALHRVCQPMLFVHFHGELNLGLAVLAKFDLCVGALADDFTDLVVLEQALGDRFNLVHVL